MRKMLNLPKATEFNKKIKKQKFYENLSISSTPKNMFTRQIQTIYWSNKIAATTTNLESGKTVTEIEVLEIQLNGRDLDTDILRQIDKEIPYHIIFVLSYDNKCQLWTAYKEKTAYGNNAFKIGAYYHTDWISESELLLEINGLNIDEVYENFVRQIAGEALKQSHKSETLKESFERSEKRKKLEKEISKLQNKVRKEKQMNKQFELNAELKKLKKELINT